MESCQKSSPKELSIKKVADIKGEIKKVVQDHLNAKDATTALSYYTDNATIASNGFLYPSFDLFADDIKSFYSSLSKINLSVWDEIHIDIICDNAAIVTAKFRWSSTDTSSVITNLQGVWSALFIKANDSWKMSVRHESFAPSKEQ